MSKEKKVVETPEAEVPIVSNVEVVDSAIINEILDEIDRDGLVDPEAKVDPDIPQEAEKVPCVEPTPEERVVEFVEEAMQNIQNAIERMDNAIDELRKQDQGITRLVTAKQQANVIMKAIQEYIK